MSYDSPEKNRRLSTRMNKKFLVNVRKKDEPGLLMAISEIHNISQGGLSFVSQDPINSAEKLILEIQAPMLPKPIIVEGTVLESIVKAHAGNYHIRLKYDRLDDEVMLVLRRLEKQSGV